MRKIFMTFAFVAIAMLAFNKVSTASTTIRFNLNVADNGITCSMPYGGYYYVRVFIKLNGNIICQHDQYDVTNTSNTLITWVCDQDLSVFSCTYEVVVDICRFAFPNTFTCCESGFTTTNVVCWWQLTGGQWVDYISINN